MSALKVKNAVFSNGKEMPMVGFGGYYSDSRKVDQSNVTAVVESAIDMGYRHFDTAWSYKTEKGIGTAIKNKIAAGVVKREDLFITTKLSWGHYNVKDVREGLSDSMRDLQVDYLDLYLVHWPCGLKRHEGNFFMEDLSEAYNENDHLAVWKIMEEFVQKGLVKSIGLSNFNRRQVQNILDHCTIKPAVIQLEVNLYHQNTKLTKFCQEKGITVVGYTPLGSPSPDWAPKNFSHPLKDPVLNKLAEKYKKSVGQLTMMYTIQRGIPVIPFSSKPERQKQNLDLFDVTLSDEDMAALAAVDKGQRLCFPPPGMENHKDYPFNDPY